MPTLDFREEDLDQFTPQVREGILRLAQQQAEAEARARVPDRGKELKILSRTTDEEQQAKIDSQKNLTGGIHLPPINDRDLRLRRGADE